MAEIPELVLTQEEVKNPPLSVCIRIMDMMDTLPDKQKLDFYFEYDDIMYSAIRQAMLKHAQ